MKIIDFKKRGNLVRFYLGEDDLADWYGDDWNDYPYEHNAGIVYERFEGGVRDVVFPFDMDVMEPSEDWHNSGNSSWSKNDMKARRVPCIVAIKRDEHSWWDDEFNSALANATSFKFYFGDHMEPSNTTMLFKEDDPYDRTGSHYCDK
jgi:hypothetical protein